MHKILLLLIATSTYASLMGMAQHKQITPALPANNGAARMEDIELTRNTATQSTTSDNARGFCDNSCDLMCCGVCAACMLCPIFSAAVVWIPHTSYLTAKKKSAIRKQKKPLNYATASCIESACALS